MSDEVMARITPTMARRVMGVAMLGSLGVLLVWLGLNSGEVGLWLRVVFLGLGIGALLLSEKVWRRTGVSLVLTEAGLAEEGGQILVAWADVVLVERGAFAFKPSNGFAIKLARAAPVAWAPGLWWRYGRRLGVGGVVSRHEAKAMADTISMRLRGPIEGLE